MSTVERPLIVAVCGSPGSGKTTVATAIAGQLGTMAVCRDDLANGLQLSGVSRVAARGRAEALLVETACRFATAGMSVVVENSVLSRELIDGLLATGAWIVAVHVTADAEVIGRRLRERTVRGRPVPGGLVPVGLVPGGPVPGGSVAVGPVASGPVASGLLPGGLVGGIRPGDLVLLEQFERGEMPASIFEPPAGVHEVLRIDTSGGGAPEVGPVTALLTSYAFPVEGASRG